MVPLHSPNPILGNPGFCDTLESLGIQAMARHAVVQAGAAGDESFGLGIINAKDEAHDFVHQVNMVRVAVSDCSALPIAVWETAVARAKAFAGIWRIKCPTTNMIMQRTCIFMPPMLTRPPPPRTAGAITTPRES